MEAGSIRLIIPCSNFSSVTAGLDESEAKFIPEIGMNNPLAPLDRALSKQHILNTGKRRRLGKGKKSLIQRQEIDQTIKFVKKKN